MNSSIVLHRVIGEQGVVIEGLAVPDEEQILRGSREAVFSALR